ncbi:MAG: tetratricopeptide repeat protein [Bacteriovorax sp.]|nr:tetratricopeptide repeat protein [Bacteriovorax sp.]
MSNTTTAPNRSLNQIVDEGDLGSFVSKNKNALIAFIAGIVIVVIGFGFYSSFADKSKKESNSKIYAFENGVLKNFNDQTSPKILVDGVKNLQKEVGHYAGLVPVVLKTSDLLMDKQHLNESLEVLTLGAGIAKNEYALYFILSRLAVVYEDLGQDQKAIETLEKMNAKSLKIFEGKNYLDLGRLYLKQGNKEKAKASFSYVVEKVKDESEFVKIAKLYLTKI